MPAEKVTSLTPWHIVLVLDDSASMSGDPSRLVNEAVEGMISELQMLSQGKKPYFKLSVISFGSRPIVIEAARTEQEIPIHSVTQFSGSSGTTDAAAALREVARLLQKHGGAPTDFTPYVFFMSDGQPDDQDKAVAAADALKQLDIPAGSPRLVAVGVQGANEAFMRSIASAPELFIMCDIRTLTTLFPLIGTNVGSITGGGAEAMDKMIAEAGDVTEL